MMRADALRNRDAVLAAAGRLFDEAGSPDDVSMDAVAAAAGVGKGTLFRRFGDRAGLLRALHEHRCALMEGVWEPDPGRQAAERVLDLLQAIVRFKADNRALTRAIEGAGRASPYDNHSYDHWHAMVAAIVAEGRGQADDSEFLAHALLAAVRGDLLDHLRDWSDDRLQAGLAALVAAVVEP
jgi:AcrR family transcriptional regulator